VGGSEVFYLTTLSAGEIIQLRW